MSIVAQSINSRTASTESSLMFLNVVHVCAIYSHLVFVFSEAFKYYKINSVTFEISEPILVNEAPQGVCSPLIPENNALISPNP